MRSQVDTRNFSRLKGEAKEITRGMGRLPRKEGQASRKEYFAYRWSQQRMGTSLHLPSSQGKRRWSRDEINKLLLIGSGLLIVIVGHP